MPVNKTATDSVLEQSDKDKLSANGDSVDNTSVKEKVSKEEAEQIKAELEGAGAEVEVM